MASTFPTSTSELQKPKPWYRSLPYFVRGDIDAYFAVFSNNISTMLAGSAALLPLGADIVYERVMPGIAISMLFGSIFYTVQAQLKASQTGRTDLCAQPFGINTPGVFAFAGGILMPIFIANGKTPEAGELAWKVGVVANLLQGIVEIALCVVGPYLVKALPMMALLCPLASVGMAYLFLNPLQLAMGSSPLVGLLPFFIFFMAMYANVTLPKLPKTLVPVIVGTVLAWATGNVFWSGEDGLHESFQNVGWHPSVPQLAPFEHFAEVANYIGVIVPVALTVSISTIQCVEIAAQTGDDYNLRASMLGDGLATVVAALFGSPFGMTVFIGHPAFKAMGAKIGYSLGSGLSFILVCFSGLGAVFLRAIPIEALNAILMFVGLAICSDALDVTPKRHWPVFIVAVIPAVCNWAITACGVFAEIMCGEKGCTMNPHSVQAFAMDNGLLGLFTLGQGYIVTSIYLTCMLVYVVDREFLKASLWAFISSFSAMCGLIHSEVVFLPWRIPSGHPTALVWNFVATYAVTGLMFLSCAVLQRFNYVEEPLATTERKEAAKVEHEVKDVEAGACRCSCLPMLLGRRTDADLETAKSAPRCPVSSEE